MITQLKTWLPAVAIYAVGAIVPALTVILLAR